MGLFQAAGELGGKLAANIIVSNVAVWGGGIRAIFTGESWDTAMRKVVDPDDFRSFVNAGGSIGEFVGDIGGEVVKQTIVNSITGGGGDTFGDGYNDD